MAQKTAFYRADIQLGSNRYVTPAYELPTRRELVEYVNMLLAECDFSARTRRQVSLPMVWQHIQRTGSGSHVSFKLESVVAGHTGTIRFIGMTENGFNNYLHI